MVARTHHPDRLAFAAGAALRARAQRPSGRRRGLGVQGRSEEVFRACSGVGEEVRLATHKLRQDQETDRDGLFAGASHGRVGEERFRRGEGTRYAAGRLSMILSL